MSGRVVVIGAKGFVGQPLVEGLRNAGHDVLALDERDETTSVDISDAECLARSLPQDTTVIVSLAGALSATCERDPALAHRVNVGGIVALVDVARQRRRTPAVISTSSVAAFGPGEATDDTIQMPRSTYGTTKAMAELALTDATRRGDVVGCTLRLPTLLVKESPGGGAASAFVGNSLASARRRDGVVLPVTPDTEVVLASRASAVANLVHLVRLAADSRPLPVALNHPGFTISAADLARACSELGASAVDWRPDPIVMGVVATWPGRWTAASAERYGLRADSGFDECIAGWLAETAGGLR